MEGPEPDSVRELLDAAQGGPGMTSEQRARMHRRLYTAIAEDDRLRKRRRTMTHVGMATAATVAFAAGVVLVLRFVRPDSDANNARPTMPEPQPALSVTTERLDAGPVRRPGKRHSPTEPPSPR
jgi:hypothetical protein